MEREPKGRAEKLRLKKLINLQAIANELKQKNISLNRSLHAHLTKYSLVSIKN
jgi:hypothetical protein